MKWELSLGVRSDRGIRRPLSHFLLLLLLPLRFYLILFIFYFLPLLLQYIIALWNPLFIS